MMLINKNKLDVGDVVCVALLSGQEVIGKISEITETSVTLDGPKNFHLTPNGPALGPFSHMGNPEVPVSFNRSLVVAMYPPIDEFANEYTRIDSGIQIAQGGLEIPRQ